MKEVGEIIAELRAERNMNQKELAKILSLSVSTISNYEKGVHAPDLDTLRTIADTFGVTTDYLLGRTNYRCSPESLEKYMTTDYTVSNFINTVISLDKSSRTSITDFADYLKARKRREPKPKKPNPKQ